MKPGGFLDLMGLFDGDNITSVNGSGPDISIRTIADALKTGKPTVLKISRWNDQEKRELILTYTLKK